MGIIIAYFQTEPDALGGIVMRVLQHANMMIEDKGRGRLKPPTRSAEGKLVWNPVSGGSLSDRRGSFF